MKNRLLALVAWVLAACLSAGLSACGVAGTGEPEASFAAADTPGWQLHADEPVTLSWYINFSWFTSTWDDSLVAKTITEETGVSIDFVTPPGNEWEKLNAMVASGTLPDLVTLGHWEPQVSEMVGGGLVYSLGELADEYDPYFWQVANPQRVAWYTQEDGELYAYPNSSYTPADYERHPDIGSNQVFLVRKDIYEAIGSPDMSTPEGFVQAVRDAAAQFPDVGGQPLLPVGLYEFTKDGCFSLEAVLMNMLAVPFEQEGRVYDRYSDPDYLAWLKVFRQLREEGYLPSDIFVDRRVQMAENVADGRYFCMLYQDTDIADQQKLLYSKSPGSEYIAVDGPKNAAGDDHTLPGVGINGWTVTLISKNCQSPDRAIQLMSYMMSEHGQQVLYCGVEGETYDLVDGEVVMRPEVLALLNSDRVEYNRRFAADNTYWMLQDNAMQLSWRPPLEAPLAQPREWTYPYTVYTAQYDMALPADSEAAAASENIHEEWGRVLPKLLFAGSEEEFDSLFSAFLQKRGELGYALVEEEATRQMVLAKERLDLL